MHWDEWKFSLEVAWDDPWYRWQTSLTAGAALAGSLYFLWRLIPEGVRSGLLVMHYNLYFGIDEVMPWYWITVFFAGWWLLLAIDLMAAGWLFRKDRIMSRVLVCVATVFTVLALLGGFYLTAVNI